MNRNESALPDKLLFYRITALWAVCEGMLGGIIHGFNLPGTGMFISSASVICICLLAWYFPVKGIILKATIIVCIFKMILSPHSPPTAYIAVLFQGLVGELVFMSRKAFKVSCMLLAVLALVESAIQRILVLTVIYGTQFWKAIDQFISKVTGDKELTSFSWYIAIVYVFIHLVVGIFIGKYAARLTTKSGTTPLMAEHIDSQEDTTLRKRRKSKRMALFVIWVLLLVLYIQSAFNLGEPILPSVLSLQIIIRSVLIVCLWYFILSPLLSLWLKTWLKKKQYILKEDVEAIVAIIPSTRQVLVQSWKNSSDEKGLKRLRSFTTQALSRTVSR